MDVAAQLAATASITRDLNLLVDTVRGLDDISLESRVEAAVGRSLETTLLKLLRPVLVDELNRRNLMLEAPPVVIKAIADSRATCSTSSSSTSPVPPPLPFDGYVRNKASGVIHRLLPQDKVDVSSWAVVCGWRFASSSNAVVVTITDAESHKLICEKCMDEVRSAKKADLTTRARGQ